MKSLLLIDLSGIFWTNWHATADQEVSAAFDLSIQKVRSAAQGFDLVAVCCDSPPYSRREILPDYKANRAAAPPQALEQFQRVKERLAADGFLLWSAPCFEADDVIATAALKAADMAVTILSSDKDLLQLVSDSAHVQCVSIRDGKSYDVARVVEKFGVHPADLGDALALIGDASDNVPGVPGIGPKKAAKLLTEFGTLAGIFAGLEQIQGSQRVALETHGAAARLARQVIQLRTDAPIDFAELFAARPVQRLNTQEDFSTMDNDSDEPMSAPSQPEATRPEPAPTPEQTTPIDPKPIQTAQALAVIPPPSWDLGLEPVSAGGAYKLAKGLFESRLYSKFGNPEAIWAVIIRGREIGLGALTALDCFHVVEGKPAIHAHLIVARAKALPECEYFQFVGGDDTFAEYVTKHRDDPEPTRLRYTIEQAKRAGLCPEKPRPRPEGGEKDRRGNWEKRPDEMLRKTAAVQLARIVYPEAAMGLYAIEELEST